MQTLVPILACIPSHKPLLTNKIYICLQTSSYCRGDPIFTLADNNDLQIVCGEYSIESPDPEALSPEREAVLDIKEFVNHPDYQPNGARGVGGPLEGNDISVYFVDATNFTMGKNCFISQR